MELRQSEALRAELEAAIGRGESLSVLAEIVTTSPFIEGLVRQFTAKRHAGSLERSYDQVADDWHSVTRTTVWMNARSAGGKVVGKSLEAHNFGA